MQWNANWIAPSRPYGRVCPIYRKTLRIEKPLTSARLYITATGIYEARLDGQRIADQVLTPGWTSYRTRLQYQCYELRDFFAHSGEKTLTVTVGAGWMRTNMAPWSEASREAWKKPGAIIAELHLDYADGSHAAILTDESWEVSESALRFRDLYDGVIYDASFDKFAFLPAAVTAEYSKDCLIPTEGEAIREHERIEAARIFRTPKGETVVDFGQNMAGYVSFCVDAHAGDRVKISHGEILDRDGNFYNANYRTAKAQIDYTCREGMQRYTPRLTFFGFRYLRLDEFPGEPRPEQFTAVAVYSDMERTGRITTGHALLNRLMSNILWGQRSNFIDVPTDCPQRDERRGWTGDAQVFLRAATYQYNVKRFYQKWLRDLAADQRENGAIPDVIPEVGGSSRSLDRLPSSAAWGDAAVRIAPVPSRQLGWLSASLRTAHGVIRSAWRYEDGRCRYEIETPVPAEITIGGRTRSDAAGTYLFFE